MNDATVPEVSPKNRRKSEYREVKDEFMGTQVRKVLDFLGKLEKT